MFGNMAGMSAMMDMAQGMNTPDGLTLPAMNVTCGSCIALKEATPAKAITVVFGTPVCQDCATMLMAAIAGGGGRG